MSAPDRINDAVDHFNANVANLDRPYSELASFLLTLKADDEFSDRDVMEVQARLFRLLQAKSAGQEGEPAA